MHLSLQEINFVELILVLDCITFKMRLALIPSPYALFCSWDVLHKHIHTYILNGLECIVRYRKSFVAISRKFHDMNPDLNL